MAKTKMKNLKEKKNDEC